MPLILPGNVASATASTTYDVDNSCRFNKPDSAYLVRTLGTPTDVDKWSYSVWVKRANLGANNYLIVAGSDGTNWTEINFGSADTLRWADYQGSYDGQLITTRVFRDVGAWYHLLFAYDADNGVAGNRMRIYVNGVEETSFSTDDTPVSGKDMKLNSAVSHTIGSNVAEGGTVDFDGYMAEVCFIDGQQLTPTSFGEFDEDSPTIWKPIDVSGLTFGDNGFYLDFEDSDNLGDDESGNSNDFTETNIDATDQATDTPTNNFCTMNPLFDGTGLWSSDIAVDGRTSEGNCKVSGGEHMPIMGTMAIGQMKTYYECHVTDYNVAIGYMATTPNGGVSNSFSDARTAAVYVYDLGGSVVHGGNWTATDNLTSAGNYMFAIDPAAGKMWFGKDGIWTGDPAAGSGNSFSSISTAHEQIPYFHTLKSAYGIASANFGGCSSFTVSSANQDANGYGNFEYAVPSGFYALCTKNLAEFGG